MLNGGGGGGSMVWGFSVYFVYMIPLETDVNIVSKKQHDFVAKSIAI